MYILKLSNKFYSHSFLKHSEIFGVLLPLPRRYCFWCQEGISVPPVCLFVCLSVSEQEYRKTTWPFPMKFGGRLQTGPRMNPLNLGAN